MSLFCECGKEKPTHSSGGGKLSVNERHKLVTCGANECVFKTRREKAHEFTGEMKVRMELKKARTDAMALFFNKPLVEY